MKAGTAFSIGRFFCVRQGNWSDAAGCVEDGEYELGFHLRPDFWKQGLAQEAGTAVIGYAFETLHANRLFAGHNPNNTASAGVLKRLGFIYMGDEFYAPTGLYHPSYIRRA